MRVHIHACGRDCIGMCWCAGNTNGPGNRADGSRGPTDASNASNGAEIAGMSHGKSVGTYLPGVGGTKRGTEVTNSVGSRADANRTANVPENVKMQRKKAKTPDLPIEAVRQHSDNVKGSSVHTEMHNIANDTETAENEAEDAKLT